MGPLNPFLDLLAQVMAFFYALVPSYGFTIIALTLLVMVIVTPLTLKGTRSMMMMQQLQPEMKKIQTQYKDDRQRLNEELMKFYKENNINPVGGCLPLLVQMPIFIVLYNVLRGLTQRVPVFNPGWIAGQIGSSVAVSTPAPANFEPAYLHPDTQMYQSLSQTSVMNFAGMDLAASCSEALSQGVVHALPYLALIAIVGATGFIQQKQIQGRMTNNQANPQQQMIMKIMPIFLPVISFGLPAGLVLYFAVSNLYRIGQQWFISRSIYGIKKGEKPSVGTGAGRTVEAKAAKGSSRSGAAKSTGTAKAASNGKAASNAKKDAVEGKVATKERPKPAAKSSNRTANGTAAKDEGSNRRTGGRRAAPSSATTNSGKASSAKGAARTDKSSSGAAEATSGSTDATSGQAPPPTLQPRARKNKKR